MPFLIFTIFFVKLFDVANFISLKDHYLVNVASAERRKVNVLEMKCFRSLVGVLRMDRVRNEEVRRSWNRKGVSE